MKWLNVISIMNTAKVSFLFYVFEESEVALV